MIVTDHQHKSVHRAHRKLSPPDHKLLSREMLADVPPQLKQPVASVFGFSLIPEGLSEIGGRLNMGFVGQAVAEIWTVWSKKK